MFPMVPFEKHAARYDGWFDRYTLVYRSELEALRSLMPNVSRAVEVGVGMGRFAAPLGVGTGVEPSEAMARLARRRGLQVVRGVGEALPLRSGAFDLVSMVTTVCFLDDVRESFSEARRALATGGYILIGILDRDSRIGEQYLQRAKKGIFFRTARFVSSREILSRLGSLGFREMKTVQTLFELPEAVREPSLAEKGYGQGLFVVTRARKPW